MERKLKRGDVREDGMVFWCYQRGCINGEWWITPEKFLEKREKGALYMRSFRASDPDYLKKKAANQRDRYANDPDYREKIGAYQRDRYANDPDYREKVATYRRIRYANDPLFAAKKRIRNRTREAFRRIASDKPAGTQELLGTDWQTLKAHIESQFVDGMNWENMSDWHIDHIIPLASAKTEEELAALCHYTNLQPLWASDNLSKGAKLPEQPCLVR